MPMGLRGKPGKKVLRAQVVIAWSKHTMLPLHNEQYGET